MSEINTDNKSNQQTSDAILANSTLGWMWDKDGKMVPATDEDRSDFERNK
ncbi:MAG: hypothetical protein ACI8Q1_003609 [Parvicella sp.]|jgi:hypothetical protein